MEEKKLKLTSLIKLDWFISFKKRSLFNTAVLILCEDLAICQNLHIKL